MTQSHVFWPRPLSLQTRELLGLFDLMPITPKADSSADNALFLLNACGPGRTGFRDGAGLRFKIDYALVSESPGGTVNAFASEHDGVYCCVVHDYFYAAVIDVAYGLLSDPKFLPALGDVARLGPCDYSRSIGNRVLSGRLQFRDIMPRCPRRKNIADLLVILTLCVAFLHEEAHVVLGHVGALKLLTKHLRLYERPVAEEAPFPLIVSQQFELQADMWAVRFLSSPMWRKTIEQNYAASIGLSPTQLMTLSWLALALLGSILLVHNDKWAALDIDQWGSHPHPIFRARELAQPSEILLAMFKEEREALDGNARLVGDGFLDAREELHKLAERNMQFAIFRGELPPELDAIVVRWNKGLGQLQEDFSKRGKYEELVDALKRSRLSPISG